MTQSSIPAFRAPYAPDDAAIARRLLAGASLPAEREARIDARATRSIEAIRAKVGRSRRGRGAAAGVFAVDQGGPGAHGARRGAVARARRRHRRPADRGQDRPGRLRAPRDPLGRIPRLRLGLGARHHGARDPAGRDAGGHPRLARQAHRRAHRAHRHAAGDARARQPFRARPDHRGGAGPRALRDRAGCYRYSFDMLGEGARTADDAERYCDPTPTPSTPSAAPPATSRCRTGPASR